MRRKETENLAQNHVYFGILVTASIPDLSSNCMQQINKLSELKHSAIIFIFLQTHKFGRNIIHFFVPSKFVNHFTAINQQNTECCYYDIYSLWNETCKNIQIYFMT